MTSTIAVQGRPRPMVPIQTRPAAAYRALLPALIIFYSTVLPMEVRVTIAEQALYPPRIAEFLLLPWLLYKMASGGLKFRPIDGVMIFGVSWMIFSFMAFYDPLTGILRSLPIAFDVIMPYLIGRVCIRNLTDLRRFLILIVPALVFAGGSMALESLTRTPIVRPLAASIFGKLSVYENGQAVGSIDFVRQTRLGLLRATGPFSHPILGGICLAVMIPFYLNTGIKGMPRYLGLAGAACGFFSLSSGAFLVILIGTGLVMADRVLQIVKSVSWRYVSSAIVTFLLLVQLLSPNGLVAILIRYTLDPSTGYYRRLIWEYGTASVWRNPLIGIGYTDFERLSYMGTSVDNHWLLIPMRHGIPAILAIGATFLYGFWTLTRAASGSTGVDRSAFVSFAAVFVSLFVAGFTVAYFGSSLTVLYFVVGASISMAAAVPARSHPHTIAPRPQPRKQK